MGRKPRLEYPGGIYHLIQRGNNRTFIFENAEDKEYLLAQILEYKEVMNFKLYGYVVMGNHYHLVLKVFDTQVSEIMHRINNKFSRYYNKKYGRTGHVFENRYKGILVVGDKYLLSLLRYVHQNPVAANMCKVIADYNWSSDKYYRSNSRCGIIDIDVILDIFSEDRPNAISHYIDFMDENKREEISVFEERDIIGDFSLIDIKKYVEKDKPDLDSILKKVASDNEIYNLIKKGSRKRHLYSYKKEFVHRALSNNYNMREIGESISISHVAVFKIYSK